MTRARELSELFSTTAVQPNLSQGRSRVNYWSNNQVEVWAPESLYMGGFRVNGQYKKGFSKTFSTSTTAPFNRAIVSFATQLGAETSAQLNCWYAVFAVANDNSSSVQFRLMPFVRVGSVSGSTVSFTYGGEGPNAYSLNPVTFSWAASGLNGTECLVITEGSGNRFSGRVTTITASTGSSFTLSSISGSPGFSIGSYDFLLPAPPGWDNYCYLGSVYFETPGDIRNIADSGSIVKARMINLPDPNFPTSGAVAAPGVQLRFGGQICPLATGVIVKETASFSTSATGSYAAFLAHDGGFHDVANSYFTKTTTSTETSSVDDLMATFSINQSIYFWTSGNVEAQRSLGKLEIRGWIEN